MILPQPPAEDHRLNRYTRAAALFRQWRRARSSYGTPQPAFYYWETDFEAHGRKRTRTGLAALVRLEPLSAGAIKPHEQTFSATKANRLELFKEARAHFSPIYSLYPDPQNLVLAEAAARPAP